MGLNAVTSPEAVPLAVRLADLVQADGSAAHPHARALRSPTVARRDLADAVHALCAVHGTLPGVADKARRGDGADDWLAASAEAFAAERGLLSRLVAASGPLPSTPGQAASEAALVGQRQALRVLASSDRAGCALGVVVALAFEWRAVRPILGNAASAFGITERFELPNPTAGSDAAIAAALASGASERALLFGADQLLAQHRGLWSLLEARAAARPS